MVERSNTLYACICILRERKIGKTRERERERERERQGEGEGENGREGVRERTESVKQWPPRDHPGFDLTWLCASASPRKGSFV